MRLWRILPQLLLLLSTVACTATSPSAIRRAETPSPFRCSDGSVAVQLETVVAATSAASTAAIDFWNALTTARRALYLPGSVILVTYNCPQDQDRRMNRQVPELREVRAGNDYYEVQLSHSYFSFSPLLYLEHAESIACLERAERLGVSSPSRLYVHDCRQYIAARTGQRAAATWLARSRPPPEDAMHVIGQSTQPRPPVSRYDNLSLFP